MSKPVNGFLGCATRASIWREPDLETWTGQSILSMEIVSAACLETAAHRHCVRGQVNQIAPSSRKVIRRSLDLVSE